MERKSGETTKIDPKAMERVHQMEKRIHSIESEIVDLAQRISYEKRELWKFVEELYPEEAKDWVMSINQTTGELMFMRHLTERERAAKMMENIHDSD